MSNSIFGSPIAFHAPLAKYLGSIEAAIFLAQAIYWRGKSSHHKTQFYKSQDEWEEETTLNAHSQRKAREILREYDWWHEERRGIPCRLWYDVDEKALRRAFFKWQDAQESGSDGNLTSNQKCAELESDDVDNKASKSSTSNTETTAENTDSTTTKRAREETTPTEYDTEPVASHGRDEVDDPEAWDQGRFLQAWEDLHGERLLTFSQYGNDAQRQKALHHIRRYWTADEVRSAFGATKGTDKPWRYFLACLEAIAAGEWGSKTESASSGMALFDTLTQEGN